jgi:signal transduction histidine kinase
LADGKRAPDALTAAVEYAKQQERQRLAGLLHDDLQQLLVAAQLGVIEAQRRLGTEGRETDHAIGEALDRVANLLRQSLSATRDLTADLARSRPQDGGLIEALGWLVQLMAERYGLRVTLTADSTAATLDAEVHQVVFDGVREALFNTVKHAGCAEAEIAVCVVGEQLRVVVSDQGNGADPARRLGVVGGGTGLGLRRTRERLHAIGGSLDVERPPGAGTRVTLHAPLTKTTAPSHLAHDDAELGQSTLRAFA